MTVLVKRKTTANLVLVAILTIILTACLPLKEKGLYGTYLAKYPFGSEKLILKPGGKYVQELSVKGQRKILKHVGCWRYAQSDAYVELESGLSFAESVDPAHPERGLKNENYKAPFDGVTLRKVRRTFPDIRLGGNGFEDIDFIKTK